MQKKIVWYKNVLLCCRREGAIKQLGLQRGGGNINIASAKTLEAFAGQKKVPLPDSGPSDHNVAKNAVGHHRSNVTTMGCKWK